TDKLFYEAMIEWLINTNQPIQAVDHPSFKKMIYVASHATKGVIIPNQNATHHEIISEADDALKGASQCRFLELVVA
ncbi:hypothetical protein BS17DRAFT_690581, partial [Gyrodon lividus]